MIRWVLIAVAGLAVAALVSLSASDLTSQPVGLSSEPLTAGDQLAPQRAVTRTVTRTVPRRARTHTTRTTTTTATTTATATPTATTGTPPRASPGDADDHGTGRPEEHDESGRDTDD